MDFRIYNVLTKTNTKMKRRNLLITAVTTMAITLSACLLLTSCQKDRDDEVLDLDMANITQMNESQSKIFGEAVSRVDKQVTFDKVAGQYRLSSGANASDLGLSSRLFSYVRSSIVETNKHLLVIKSEKLEIVETKRNRLVVFNPNDGFEYQTKGYDPDVEKPGGRNDIVFTMTGYDIYLSRNTLLNIRDGASMVGIVSGMASMSGISTPVSLPVTAVSGVTAAIAAGLVDRNPNGVVVSIFRVGVGGVPYYIKGQ